MQDQAEAAASASSRPGPEAALPKTAFGSGHAPQGGDSKLRGHCDATAMVSMHSHAREAAAAAATQSSHASLHAGATNSSLQRSVSDGTALPGSLRQRFAVTVPAQHASSACSAWRWQPSPVKAESSQAASSCQAMCDAGAALTDHGGGSVTAHVEPGSETHSATHADGPCKLEIVSSALSSPSLHHHASMPIAISTGWHLRGRSPAGTVSMRKNGMYAEQQAYWQKKEALCPTIKNCIQEVQQLRAQLSADSQQL